MTRCPHCARPLLVEKNRRSGHVERTCRTCCLTVTDEAHAHDPAQVANLARTQRP